MKIKTEVAEEFLRAAILGTIVIFLILFALFDSRSAYSSASIAGLTLSESSPAGPLPLVASLLVLCLAVALILVRLNDTGLRFSFLHFVVLMFGLCFWLTRIIHDGLASSAPALMVLLVLVSFSLQDLGDGLYLVWVKYFLRIIVASSLVAAIAYPDWGLVPQGVSDRAFLGFGSRLIGLATSPNYIALAAALLFLIELYLFRKDGRRKLLSAGFILCAAYAVLWAQSRGVIIGAGVAAVLFLVSRRSTRSFVVIAWLALLFGALAPFSRFLESLVGGDLDELASGRPEIWAGVIGGWRQYYLFGTSSPQALSMQFGAGNAHNGMLEALVTGGLPFLLVIVLLLIVVSRNVLAAGAPGALAGMFLVFVSIQSIFGTPLRTPGLSWNLILVTLLIGESARIAAVSRRARVDHLVSRVVSS